MQQTLVKLNVEKQYDLLILQTNNTKTIASKCENNRNISNKYN